MATVPPSATFAPPRPAARQNWVLDPAQDALFIIAAPAIMLAIALPVLWIFRAWGANAKSPLGVDGPTAILSVFVVFNVAHHLPTFIRAYGDVELFNRFKWSFLLGPLIPFGFAMGVSAFLITNGQSIEKLFYLFVILNVWDPWHFLMQHYGFMRIYDRPNAAPRGVAARMDLLISASWFVFVMLAAADWLPEILYKLDRDSRIPLLQIFGLSGLDPLARIAFAFAVAATVVYLAYLIWCAAKGYYISGAKLALLVITFGTMYLAYTPNEWIRALAPDWTFGVGFAVLGMVHVTQYLAIVWKFNRSLGAKPGRARAGPFRWLHERGGWAVAALYVALCLAYGALLSSQNLYQRSQWLMALVLSAGFTSTLMHYYFDGFMWKVRHRQNRENLSMSGPDSQPVISWWESFRERSPLATLGRQLLYFGLPMGLLTLGAYLVWSDPRGDYTAHEHLALELRDAGRVAECATEARHAVRGMDRLLELERSMIALRPSASRYAQLADLLYNRSCGQHLFLDALEPSRPEADRLRDHHRQVALAVAAMEQALAMNEPISATGRWRAGAGMSPREARLRLAKWKREIARTQHAVTAVTPRAAP